MNQQTDMPDIAAQRSSGSTAMLDWVGMRGIALPVRIDTQAVSARIDAGVSLDDGQTRGIHMSRLYLAVAELQREAVSPALLREVLKRFLNSHDGLSLRAYLELRGEWLIERPALISPLSGYKAYPLTLKAHLDPSGFHLELGLQLSYSSTCPCSAALARQLIQQRFADDFGERQPDFDTVHAWLGSSAGIIATPHSQRSEADIRVRLQADATSLPFIGLLDRAEAALGTAVQTAVKRADEQAFALANGQNLMFCEDAARRLHGALLSMPEVEGFHLHVTHAESLHAHDAVASASHNWR
ncbi:GTP cyclohydrolase I FolE2 [Pseudomonas seleniipraecipitans]|uniref:GTP cyclohydrolase FolE2 n=1 Tax=Phytopseudomonas seleniipraecipitans TaxID=640205 RepID=A0ABY5J6E6_9GAMM|nr:GTP cyclohydrolase FolE2 [Pseudomonas seleniipraecipitans]UUD62367.1 GTP cyclohydrolase I FolE2 [Pseudomonas seleniipraecipitans]